MPRAGVARNCAALPLGNAEPRAQGTGSLQEPLGGWPEVGGERRMIDPANSSRRPWPLA